METTMKASAGFDMYEIGRTLTPEQRSMFFRLGAIIQGSLTVRYRFSVDANYAHEQALLALEACNWKSIKLAQAILHAMRA
jgi:hypothetical protein